MKTWAQDPNSHFSHEDTEVAKEGHREKRRAPRAIGETQTQRTRRHGTRDGNAGGTGREEPSHTQVGCPRARTVWGVLSKRSSVPVRPGHPSPGGPPRGAPASWGGAVGASSETPQGWGSTRLLGATLGRGSERGHLVTAVGSGWGGHVFLLCSPEPPPPRDLGRRSDQSLRPLIPRAVSPTRVGHPSDRDHQELSRCDRAAGGRG